MGEVTTQAIDALIGRLTKRMEQDKACAANNARIVELLAPEMERFEAREGHNLYATRMAVDHANSLKRDNQWAADLEAAIVIISSALPAKDPQA